MGFTLPHDLPVKEALKLSFPESSTRTLSNWIKWGRVLLDGTPCSFHTTAKKGQLLSLTSKPLPHLQGLPVIYQDRWLLVIEKPAGLLSVPAEKEEANALQVLKAALKTPSIHAVHRLDQESSGVLLFARTPAAASALKKLFEAHDLERAYIAIAEGHLPQDRGTWECYVKENARLSMEVTTPSQGKKAITHYEVIRRSKKYSYLKLKLETGRKHQIRLHTSQAGFPIVGDKRYGSLINPFKRLCLHAYHLSFIHPFTQKKMVFTSQPSPSRSRSSKAFPFAVEEAV